MEKRKIATGIILFVIILGLGVAFVDNPIRNWLIDNGSTDTNAKAIQTPDEDKSVSLENELNRTREIRLTIIRNKTDEVVHNETYMVNNSIDDVYNTEDANPEGIEKFSVIARTDSQSSEVSIETNECFGSAYVKISRDNDLEAFYSIC